MALQFAFKPSVGGFAIAVCAAMVCGAVAAQHAVDSNAAAATPAVVYERVVSDPIGAQRAAGTIQDAQALPQGESEAARSAVRSYQQDAGSRIEELRVRGQTREITVTPSGTMPSYEVVPNNSNAISSGRSKDGTNGPRRWKLGEF